MVADTETPVGAALTPPNYPHGDGIFIPCKGKLSLIVDTNRDDKADKEIVVATGILPPPQRVGGDGVGPRRAAKPEVDASGK